MKHALAVEDIYEAAFDDECFAGFAAALASAFGVRSALVHWVHKDGAAEILSHSGYFTDEQLADYAQNFVAMDPWIEAAARAGQVNSVMNLEELVPAARFTNTEFYNEYFRAMGDDTCRCLGIRLETESGAGYLALHRGLTEDAFDESVTSRLAEYLPHIRRVLAIRSKISAAQHHAAGVSAAFDAIGLPILLVDARLRIKQANPAAEDLLREESALRCRLGTLEAMSPAANALLRNAINAALADEQGPPAAVAVPASMGAPLCLSIAPKVSRGQRLALILASAPSREQDDRAHRLRLLFRLSPSEAMLAVMLADGHSPAEIAEARQVSVGTVRLQIKHIAAKLGCNRQSQIVGVVSALPPLFTPAGRS